MVKILNPICAKKGFRGTEQYNDCSSMLKAADDPSLEELDPAILSLGLPAIMLSDIQPRMVVVPRIRYSPGQLQAIRKSALSFRRPAIVDDPRVTQFPIWKSTPTTTTTTTTPASNQSRRGCRPYAPHSEPRDDRDDDKGSHTRDKPLERPNAQQKQHHGGRESGFTGQRLRRSFEFSNRSQYAIVRSHAGDENGPQETTTAEDEPEWMAAGPTSRLDTIELRGFDDDVISPNASLDKAASSSSSSGNSSDPKLLSSASNFSTSTAHAHEKHVSFYDDLQHYEHVHPQKRGGSQGRDDVESVATSTASCSPPARSTPTKKLGGSGEPGNGNDDKPEAGGSQKQKSPQLPHNGINVHNFEQFMKFESFLGPDTSSNDQTASRFTKWFRRNSTSQNQQPLGSTFDHQQDDMVDFGSGYDIRYQLERIRQQQQQQQHQHSTSSIPRGGFHSLQPQNRPQNEITTNGPFRRLIDMLAANYAKNDMIAQQQYLLEVLNRGQQNENLRRMLLQSDAVPAPQQSAAPQGPGQRVPTHRELQFHTQTIMQNALLRKKLQDQRKLLQTQNTQMAAAAAAAAGEPSPLVQQFVQSVCPNLQRSLSVLNQTTAAISPHGTSNASARHQLFQGMPQFPPGLGANTDANSLIFPGGHREAEMTASLRQLLNPTPPAQTAQQQQRGQPKPGRSGQQNQSGRAQQAQPSSQQQQQQQPQQPGQRSGRRFGKGSVTWSNVHVPRP